MNRHSCELCRELGGELLWQSPTCRVVLVADPALPGFCRVIWQEHVAEMTDLSRAQRRQLMAVVDGVETALRELLEPDKINLASLGNVVPHLHWHVIPRWTDDRYFPAPIWAPAQREGSLRQLSCSRKQLAAVIGARIAEEFSHVA